MANISPEEILANALAPVSAAVNSYGEGQVNLAQQQFMNQLRQEAEARKNQYELGQIQLTGDIRGRNDLATEAERNRGALEQVAARGDIELRNKETMLPKETEAKLKEIDATARVFLSRMDESEKAKLRQAYAGMGFRQDKGESDDDFLLRVNKGVADHANKLFSTISENDGKAQALLNAETRRLNALAMDRATKEWATTLDDQGRKVLFPRDKNGNPLPAKTPDDVIASQKDPKKRAQWAADWSDALARAQEKAKLAMDPSIANQINSIKFINQHVEGALTKTLEDKNFAGAIPFLKFNTPAATGPAKTDAEKMAEVFGDGTKNATPGDKFTTKLPPGDEASFQAWKAKYAPNDSGADYDLRGAFKAGFTPDANGHWPDTFKKPNHPTFSVESVYAKDAPNLAGKWDANGSFIRPDPTAVIAGAPDQVLGIPEPQRHIGSSGRGNNSAKYAVASIDDEMNGIDRRLGQIQSRGGLNIPGPAFNEARALVQRKAALAAQRTALAGPPPVAAPAVSPQDIFGVPALQRSQLMQPASPSPEFFSSPQLQGDY